jgi:very-short-patch-repair endonuclease
MDVRIIELAARQHNRFSRRQLAALGVPTRTINARVDQNLWVQVHQAVFAVAPVLDDERGRWMGATLTEENSVLSHASAAAAWGFWSDRRDVEIVTRPGSGGPRRLDGVLVYRSETLAPDTTTLHGIPITAVPRTLLDLAAHFRGSLLSRCVREAIRLRTTSTREVMEALLGRHHGRRGSRRLALTLSRYEGLPIHRARSVSEVVALQILKAHARPDPRFNRRVAGEEADFSWPAHRLIIELDGPDFHRDVGEDRRKQAIWTAAGWRVERLPSPTVFDEPERLLALAPTAERPSRAT